MKRTILVNDELPLMLDLFIRTYPQAEKEDYTHFRPEKIYRI